MEGPKYQKTELGWNESQRRERVHEARARHLLILCNGRATLTELRLHFGADTDALLQGLLERGLIDVVPTPVAATGAPDLVLELPEPPVPAAPASVPATTTVQRAIEDPPPPPPPPAPPPPPSAPGAAVPGELQTLRARALEVLQRLFGPSGGESAQAVRRARDAAELEQALARVHEAISIYQGRRGADLMLARIRSGR